ncbi:MAG: hypothetical protein AAFQ63_12205 [Cyanobacteria bacterium J06621_11]
MDEGFSLRFDYSDLIAQCEAEMFAAGLSWRSPHVHRWIGEIGCPSRHYLEYDGFYFLLERLAIYICDGAPHDSEAMAESQQSSKAVGCLLSNPSSNA